MLCPKCKSQIADHSKFCVHCGTKIEQAPAAAPAQNPAPAKMEPRKCISCGSELRADATFCTRCGTKQQAVTPAPAAAAQPKPAAPVQTPAPAAAAQPKPAAPVQNPTPAAQPKPAAPVQNPAPAAAAQPRPAFAPAQNPTPAAQPRPAAPAPVPMQAVPMQQTPPKKKSKFPLVLIIIFVLIVALLVGGYFVLDKVFEINLIEMITGSEQTDKEDVDKEDTEDEDDRKGSGGKRKDEDTGDESKEPEPQNVKGDPELLNAVDPLVDTANNSYMAGSYDDAINQIKDAINQYVSIAESNNLTEEAEEKIKGAFLIAAYAAVQSATNVEAQEVGPASYEQIVNTVDPLLELADSLAQKGYNVDANILTDYNDGLITRLRKRYIDNINEITKREQWSRDEAWTYAERAYSIQKNGKIVLFDESDLDDPLRLRYVYCLARISQKRCENGIADGTMTTEQAFDAMTAVLKETDYNLLILQDIINYGSAIGKDVSKYQNAYDAIVDHIRNAQNLSVLTSGVNSETLVDVKKFWYFNDLDGEEEFKVDIHNGTTKETREWIRTNIPFFIQ